MKHKDPWDPFSPGIEHDLHVERLSRDWRESQNSFAFLGRIKSRAVVLTKRIIMNAVKLSKALQAFGRRKRLDKLELR
jgi:hypothetical protein